MSVYHCHAIKLRKTPNDVFYTPLVVSKLAISFIDSKPDDLWLDPWKGQGSFFNQFPTTNREFCEITDGIDFLKYESQPDIICSNPPYSKLDAMFKKIIELRPRVCSLVLGTLNLTPRRLQWMKDAGYGLTRIHLFKIQRWFGITMIAQWERGEEDIVSFDRIIYK